MDIKAFLDSSREEKDAKYFPSVKLFYQYLKELQEDPFWRMSTRGIVEINEFLAKTGGIAIKIKKSVRLPADKR
jgi:hypothetical protein